jgi:two-component system sensor histidine kinase FlrB
MLHSAFQVHNPQALMNTPPANEQDLQKTFRQFNQLALRLQTSQFELKTQLESLQNQLVTVNRQRLDELAAKENLAQHLQQLLQVLPVGVVVLNAQGQVISANPAVNQILEMELEGRSWREVIAQVFAPQADDGHEISLRNGKRVRLATQSLLDQGQLIVVDDLTQTRQLQKTVAQQQRLSLLGKTAASLAHQIRTPLSAMLLYVEDALSQVSDTHNTQRNLTQIKTKVQQLNQQVEDLLIFSRGDIALTDRVALADLLKSSIENVQGVSNRSLICVHCDATVKHQQLLCQQSAMIGLFTNLLRNAIEACDGEAVINIEIAKTDDENYPCRIDIIDNGIGMSEQQLAQLFEPFITHKSNGTGLGLAIVKRIADAHQIRIEFFSQHNQGTQVSLWLPATALTSVGEPA